MRLDGVRFGGVVAGVAALSACAGEAPAYVEPTRIDGSVENDGIFHDEQHHQVYCAEHPESRWCSSTGTAAQPWVSAEFHGLDEFGDEACYSEFSTRSGCQFPALKQMQIQFDTSRCLDSAPPGKETPPLLAVNTMIAAYKEGALSWNGVGSGVTVNDGTCASRTGCTIVTLRCGDTLGVAGGRLDPPFQTRVVDLPTASNGVDHDAALVSLQGSIVFDIFDTWQHILTFCPDAGSASIGAVARHVGRHEMGHIFGFGHFLNESSVMFPSLDSDCSPERAIGSAFRDALSIFDSSGGGVTLSDVGLDDQIP